LSVATLVVLFAAIAARNVIRPLAGLEKTANKLASGDFSTPLPDARSDEIGGLTRSFEIMRSSVLEHRNQLMDTLDEQKRTEVARPKGLHYGIEICPTLPAMVLGDSNRLEQVLTQLISNAIKFTEPGQVRITLSPYTATDTSVLAEFEVRDTGTGMTEAVHEVLERWLVEPRDGRPLQAAGLYRSTTAA